MKLDLYTKSVLTVIAVALCAIAFQNVKVISEAQAQDVWPTATPSEVGLDVEALDAFETDIVQGKYGYVDSILVIRHGKVAFERYYEHDYSAIYAEEARTPGPLRSQRSIGAL